MQRIRVHRVKVRPSAIFALFVGLVMGWALFVTKDFTFMAAVFPWVAGGFTLGMAVLVLVKEIRGAGGEKPRGLAMDLVADDMPASVRAKKATRILVWFLGLYLGIWLLGFKLAAVAFLTAFVSIEARAKWFLILGTAAILVFALFMLERFLGVFWLEGLLNQWLQEPLPWLF